MQWTMDEDNFGTPSLIPDDGSSSEDSGKSKFLFFHDPVSYLFVLPS